MSSRAESTKLNKFGNKIQERGLEKSLVYITRNKLNWIIDP